MLRHRSLSATRLSPLYLEMRSRSMRAQKAASKLDAQNLSKLADDSTAEQKDTDDENHPLDDEYPLSDRGQVVLERDHEEGPRDRAEQGSEPAHQGHEDDFARHRPVDVRQRGELKH